MMQRGELIPLTREELADVSAILYAHTGMVFGESKRYYIERRIADLVRESGTDSTQAYLASLDRNARGLEKLINSFTINETYFYREDHQLACLSQSILPQIIQRKGPGDRIRILSIPCSTGEEAYSIALWLLENWALVDAYNVEIVGSDIDSAALRDAAVGLFSQRSIGRLPKPVLESYFTVEENAEWRLISDLRESVSFVKANIIDQASLVSLGRFDVIFCRNLLIYFDNAARATAAANIHDMLVPGGYICLGHTESMTRISDDFDVARFPEAIVYRRAEIG